MDVIIANCVINLSTYKSEVFREAHRVLAPGGRFAVSDIVIRSNLDPAIRQKVLAFVQSYGALHYRPGRWLVADFLREAFSLHGGMALAKEIACWERDGISEDDGLRAKRNELAGIVHVPRGGVRLMESFDRDAGRLRRAS